VRQGSGKETAQPFHDMMKIMSSFEISVSNESNETCVERRRNGFDETNILTGARLRAA